MKTVVKFKILSKASTPDELDEIIKSFDEIMSKVNARYLLDVEKSDPYYTGLLSIEWHCNCSYFELEQFIKGFGIIEAEINKLKMGAFSLYTLIIDGSLH